jgi:hypothetical protein
MKSNQGSNRNSIQSGGTIERPSSSQGGKRADPKRMKNILDGLEADSGDEEVFVAASRNGSQDFAG